MKKPYPVPTPDSRPFWNGLAEQKILLKHCRDCECVFHYPRITCPNCLSSDLEWKQASGQGTLYTYTISRRPTHPLFADEVPQFMAVVELEEGPRITSTLLNVPEDKIQIGMALTPVFEHNEKEKITLLRFQPADTALRGSAPSAAEDKPTSASQFDARGAGLHRPGERQGQRLPGLCRGNPSLLLRHRRPQSALP